MTIDHYVGADLHSKTTTLVVYDSKNNKIQQTTVVTRPELIIRALIAVSGKVALTFEESPLAHWMYGELRPHVAELIVCDPRHNKLLAHGTKSDKIDADKLAQLLRTGALKPVFHSLHATQELRQITAAYRKLVKDRTRVKNQLKAIFRSRGIETTADIYDLTQYYKWVERLLGRALRCEAHARFMMLGCLNELVADLEKVLLETSKDHKAVNLLKTVPGIGPVRAAVIVGTMQHPFRFRTRAHLWAYAGLSVITRSSSDYEVVAGTITKRPGTRARGLTKHYNHALKDALKGAATSLCKRGSIYHEEFKARILKGQDPANIRLTFARRIAAICLTIWKKGVRYDPSHYHQP